MAPPMLWAGELLFYQYESVMCTCWLPLAPRPTWVQYPAENVWPVIVTVTCGVPFPEIWMFPGKGGPNKCWGGGDGGKDSVGTPGVSDRFRTISLTLMLLE